MAPMNDDYYATLNVPPHATTDDIQKAYKGLSKIFHPDRLRARSVDESELAQETFVRIKTAHDILCDPVYRFVYDQYGRRGVRYLQSCERAKQSQQEDDVSWDIHLYAKLKRILEEGDRAQHISLAIRILKQAMKRWQHQIDLTKQRLKESSYEFDAMIELSCSHHPQGAELAGYPGGAIPYLEMEKSHVAFTVKAANLNAPKTFEGKPQGPQRNIVSASFGAVSKWSPTGKAETELSIGAEYQATQSAYSKWGFEATTPVTWVKSKARPIILDFTSSHSFAGGTSAVAGLRGTPLSRESWACSFTTVRRLSTNRFRNPNSPDKALQGGELRGSCGASLEVLTGRPSSFFVGLNNIPSPRKSPKAEGESPATSPWIISNPQLSLRAGYLPSPVEASIRYEEFGKPWASLVASWSFNFVYSKIKVMLSTDLWGSYESNDTTTIRTGLKHDMMSGWIWLWEWEELDWTLKVPISLSASKNSSWILIAMGSDLLPGEFIHETLGTLLASYIVIKVARSMLTDWAGDENKRNKGSQQNATISDDHQVSFPAEDNEIEGNELASTFRSLMDKVAGRKRQTELARDGLVIRSAVVSRRKKSLAAHALDAEEIDLDYFFSTTARGNTHNLTEVLQFWVRDGKLSLPPLSTQKAPHYYCMGGKLTKIDCLSDALMSLRGLSNACKSHWRTAMSWLGGGGVEDSPELLIRYQHHGNVYEISLEASDHIVLPSAGALRLGPANRIN